MNIKKFTIYLANLDPRFGTEPGKVRPVVILQTDLLNDFHPSTIVCPITTKINKKSKILRVHLNKKINNLEEPSDILVDQIRTIDNRRFVKMVGKLDKNQIGQLVGNLKILIFE